MDENLLDLFTGLAQRGIAFRYEFPDGGTLHYTPTDEYPLRVTPPVRDFQTRVLKAAEDER